MDVHLGAGGAVVAAAVRTRDNLAAADSHVSCALAHGHRRLAKVASYLHSVELGLQCGIVLERVQRCLQAALRRSGQRERGEEEDGRTGHEGKQPELEGGLSLGGNTSLLQE